MYLNLAIFYFLGVTLNLFSFIIHLAIILTNRCFLLIQAFITGEELPISDYITDTYTVIDQLPRLIAAMRYLVEQDSRNNCIFDLICIFSIIRQVLKTKAMVRCLIFFR